MSPLHSTPLIAPFSCAVSWHWSFLALHLALSGEADHRPKKKKNCRIKIALFFSAVSVAQEKTHPGARRSTQGVSAFWGKKGNMNFQLLERATAPSKLARLGNPNIPFPKRTTVPYLDPFSTYTTPIPSSFQLSTSSVFHPPFPSSLPPFLPSISSATKRHCYSRARNTYIHSDLQNTQ